MKISIILCTYNRSALLNKLLQSFTHLIIPDGVVWELLIIDNNSPDDTKKIVDTFTDTLPIHYHFEPEQGKCHALNHAVKKAAGDLFLFVDDDVVVEPNWLSEFFIAAEDTRYSWFGGRVKPDWQGDLPRWYVQETAPAFDGYFGNYDLGGTSLAYRDNDKLPLGASLAIRRDVFDAIGEFRLDLGPRGKLRGVGDETEFLERAIKAGFQGCYVGSTRVLHHVGTSRLRFSGYINYGLGKGINQYRMGLESGRKSTQKTAVIQLCRGLLQLLKGRGDRFRLCLINYGMELGRRRSAAQMNK